MSMPSISRWAAEMADKGWIDKRVRHKETGLEGVVYWDGRDRDEGLEIQLLKPIRISAFNKRFNNKDHHIGISSQGDMVIAIAITSEDDFESTEEEGT